VRGSGTWSGDGGVRGQAAGARGDAEIPAFRAISAFRADLARVTGRSDIDGWNNLVDFGDPLPGPVGSWTCAASRSSPWMSATLLCW